MNNPTRDQIIDIIENRPGLTIDDDVNAIIDLFAPATPDDDCIRIKRADLPKVVADGEWVHVDGLRYRKDYESAIWRREVALRNLAIVKYLDAKEAKEVWEAAKEAELTARRAFGELPSKRGYALSHSLVRHAIDRIIEAEDKLAEFEAQA